MKATLQKYMEKYHRTQCCVEHHFLMILKQVSVPLSLSLQGHSFVTHLYHPIKKTYLDILLTLPDF